MAALIPVEGALELLAPPLPGSDQNRPELLYWEDPSGARWYFCGQKAEREGRNPRAEAWVREALGREPGVIFGAVLFLSPEEVKVMTETPRLDPAAARKSRTVARSKDPGRSRT